MPRNRRRPVSWSAIALLWLGSAFAPMAVSADKPVPMTRETATKLKTTLDETWPPLLEFIDHWRQLSALPEDFRGVTLKDDLAAFVLTAEQRSDIERRRRAVNRQISDRDWPGAIFEAVEAMTAVRNVAYRLGAVQSYWLYSERHARRRQDWQAALAAHQLADDRAPALLALEESLRQRVSAADFQSAVREQIPALEAHWESIVAVARSTTGVDVLQHDPLRRKPAVACGTEPAVQPVTAPSPSARVDPRRSKPTSAFYPFGAVRGGRIGLATVRVMVIPEGCARWAELVQSSGHVALDEAALRYAVDGARYEPARQSGRAVAATMTYRINFEIAGAEPILPKSK